MNELVKSIVLMVAFTVLVAACDKEKETNTSPTNIKIYMHDQAIDYQQVNVEILSVILKGNGDNEEIDLESNAGVYNLLDYQNGLDTLLGEITVEFDTLKQIRLILGYENSVMVDSILYPMTTPSAHSSGYKIMVNEELIFIDSLTVSLDFDAAESVKVLGNGTYKLDPVIHLD